METLVHLLGPLHPPLVHFAVACPILAFFAVIGQRFWKKPWLSYSAGALWIFGFLAALGALLTGHLFSLHLGMETQWAIIPPKTAMKGHLRDHALLGTFSFLFSILTVWASVKIIRNKPWPSGFLLFLGLTVAVLFGITGHEGGEMVYGAEDNPNVAASASPTPPAGNLLEMTQNYSKVLVKMNSKTWNSRTHGHRWVNTYVSKEAVGAYKNSKLLPEGSLVVKESFENVDGKPSTTAGPLYVMLKGKASDSPSTGGWQFALQWDKPVPGNNEQIQTPVKWLPGDHNLNYCVRCHNRFKAADYLGGIPEGFENP